MARVLVTLIAAIVAGAAALPVTSVGVGWLVSVLAALAAASVWSDWWPEV